MAEELVGDVLCRKRGDTAPDRITVLDSESTTTPQAALNITGFIYTLTINTERDPDPGPPEIGNELVQITGTITDAANGEVEFTFSAAQADQVPETYWYDIQQVDASGSIKTIAKNKYIFYQDVTKI